MISLVFEVAGLIIVWRFNTFDPEGDFERAKQFVLRVIWDLELENYILVWGCYTCFFSNHLENVQPCTSRVTFD